MRPSVKLLSTVAAASLAFAATPAMAASFLFELTGGKTASFVIDTDTPDFSSSSFIGNQVRYDNVSGTFGGTEQTVSSVSFGTFLVSSFQISGSSLGFTQYAGPEMFSGDPAMPVFAPGSYALTSITSGAATLTISELAAAVPEPTTWAMMVIGFGMIGGAIRYRKGRKTVRFA